MFPTLKNIYEQTDNSFLEKLKQLRKFELDKYPKHEYPESDTWLSVYTELANMHSKDNKIHGIIDWVYKGSRLSYSDYEVPIVAEVEKTVKELIDKKLKEYWNKPHNTEELEKFVNNLQTIYGKYYLKSSGPIKQIFEYLNHLISYLNNNWTIHLPEQTAETSIKANIKNDYLYNIKRLMKEEPMFILKTKKKWAEFMGILNKTLKE